MAYVFPPSGSARTYFAPPFTQASTHAAWSNSALPPCFFIISEWSSPHMLSLMNPLTVTLGSFGILAFGPSSVRTQVIVDAATRTTDAARIQNLFFMIGPPSGFVNHARRI